MGLKSQEAGLTTGYRLGVFVNVVLICLLGTILAVLLVAGVQQVAYQRDLRFDMTADRRYSLDPLAKQLLRDLEAPLEILFVWGYDTDILERVKDPRGQPRGDLLGQYYLPILQAAQVRVGDVLREWEKTTPHLSVSIIEQDRDPVGTEELARSLGLSSQEVLNKITFRLGTRRRVVPLRRTMVDMQWGYFPADPYGEALMPRPPGAWRVQEELTATLRSIMAGDDIPIGVATGIGGTLEPLQPEYTILAGLLEGEGYKPTPFPLVAGGRVPEGVQAVIVSAPRMPLDRQRIRILEEYERKGGRLLVVASPRHPESFASLLEPYGVRFLDTVLDDPKNTNTLRGGRELESSELISSNHPIVAALRNRVTLAVGQARPLAIDPDKTPGAERRSFLAVSQFATQRPVEFDAQTGNFRIVESRVDPAPEAPFAAALERPVTGGAPARVVALGSIGLFRPDFVLAGSLFGNRDLILNSLAWLTDRESAIGLTPSPSLTDRFVDPNRLLTPFSVVAVGILPLLAAVIGISIFFLRRS
jgi:hypothetical protein